MDEKLLEAIVAALRTSDGEHSSHESEIAREHHAIAALMDMGGALAVRPNGEVIEVLWDHPSEAKVITDAKDRNIAYFILSQRYYQLFELLPKRTQHAVACRACGGSGKANVPEQLQQSIRCWCGGLGWVPDEASQMPSVETKIRQRPWWKRW